MVLLAESCKKENSEAGFQNPTYTLEYGNLPTPTIPGDNPLTVEGVKLGRMLFYEKALSGDGTMACADCHRQEHAFTDTARFSTGIEGQQGGRQAMSVFNTLWHENEFFWDGRAHLLRDQALLPIQDPLEMNETLENAVAKLSSMSLYTEQFNKAFGSSEITSERVSLALEQFMNSIVSYRSKYDQYLEGKATLTPEEERGRKLFFAEYNPFFPEISGADCAHCHSGSNFENDLYMNNGLDSTGSILDIGREKVTGKPNDKGRFKVTSLRNIALTAPYMHDGRFSTLEEVVDHYNEGIHDSPSLDPALKNTISTGLMLDAQEKADLIAFMKTLTDYALITDARYSNPH
ncbi:MAG: c-type cytochrome [Bacteroidota bacterium]|nr:c-type cytochrome [Bacteroidota bacterium]MDX5469389.1 c-type cytochrome [Bacteroidota bacterium]